MGVPGMIYVVGASGLISSASELVIAFIMGFGGSVKWAIHGMVDIRLTLIILAGSLLGVQLGAIGTTYVKEHMIKVVMGTIMIIVAFSRALAVPKYLEAVGPNFDGGINIALLELASFITMCAALAIGAIIILGSMWKGRPVAEPDVYAAAPVKESYEHV